VETSIEILLLDFNSVVYCKFYCCLFNMLVDNSFEFHTRRGK